MKLGTITDPREWLAYAAVLEYRGENDREERMFLENRKNSKRPISVEGQLLQAERLVNRHASEASMARALGLDAQKEHRGLVQKLHHTCQCNRRIPEIELVDRIANPSGKRTGGYVKDSEGKQVLQYVKGGRIPWNRVSDSAMLTLAGETRGKAKEAPDKALADKLGLAAGVVASPEAAERWIRIALGADERPARDETLSKTKQSDFIKDLEGYGISYSVDLLQVLKAVRSNDEAWFAAQVEQVRKLKMAKPTDQPATPEQPAT